jgi:hypothetical protein
MTHSVLASTTAPDTAVHTTCGTPYLKQSEMNFESLSRERTREAELQL